MTKLWQKGYELNKEIEEFTSGADIANDQKLVKYDAVGSIAHAKMLYKVGLLSEGEFKSIHLALKELIIIDKIGSFKVTFGDEDVHTAVENHLTKKLGQLGKKLHTARSRNDQILVDLRLFYKEKLLEIKEKALMLASALLEFSKKNKAVPMPGYTHMQRAMLSSAGLWASSFAESLLDDLDSLDSAYKITDQCPLGSAAGYGVGLEIDRQFTSDLLGFGKVQNNVLYVQNSRGKIELSVLFSLSQIMQTLNKLAADLMLFTTKEFDLVSLPSEFCTGSSIMPQKKNYDVLELIRSKYALLSSHYQAVSAISSNLPSGFNRDLQDSKKPTIDGLELASKTLSICALVIKNLGINEQNCISACTPELFATDAAYELVNKGVPFRDAYKEVAKNQRKITKFDPHEALNKRKHVGACANLGLDKLEKQIEEETTKVIAEKTKFENKIKQLLEDAEQNNG